MNKDINQSTDFNNFSCSCGNQITKRGEYVSGSLTKEQTGDRTVLGKCTQCKARIYTINFKELGIGIDSIIIH